MGKKSRMDRSAIPTAQTPAYYYEVDGEDRIVATSDTWDSFALENEGEHLTFDRIEGSKIWDHVTDRETADIYRRIFDAARKGRRVQFFLRCDSPTVRRMLSVNVESADSSHGLRISTLLFRADQRDFIDLRNTSEGGSLFALPACSWCEKVLVPEHDWQEIESAAPWLARGVNSQKCRFSYTVCPQCKEQVERQLRLIE